MMSRKVRSWVGEHERIFAREQHRGAQAYEAATSGLRFVRIAMELRYGQYVEFDRSRSA
jgi:hypothetical protein